MRFSALVALVAALVLFSAEAKADADQCRDILIYAAKNQNQSLDSSNINSQIKNALCSDASSSNASGSSFGGGLSVFGFGSGNVSSARNSIQAVRNQSCSSGSSELSKDQFDQVVSDLVDHASVDAWHKCMDKGGLVGSIERNGNIAIVRLQWVAPFGVDRTEITDVDVDGIVCKSMWSPGTVVSSVKLQKQCKADPKLAISITVQAQNDAVTLTSPAEPVFPVTTSVPISRREKCLGGDAGECAQLEQDLTASCNQQFPNHSNSLPQGASWRMCTQNILNIQDYVVNLNSVKVACEGALNSTGCFDAQQKRDQSKSVLTGAYALPSMPMFSVPGPHK